MEFPKFLYIYMCVVGFFAFKISSCERSNYGKVGIFQ